MNIPLIKIASHSGRWHEDEIVAVSILTTIFKNHGIIRSRDKAILDTADFVVDVGDVYDHTTRRYDHHMADTPRDDDGHRLSSAGLIWRHYYRAYLTAINIPTTFKEGNETIHLLEEVASVIKNRWIHPIDLVDNGDIAGPTVISELVANMRPISSENTKVVCDRKFNETVALISNLLERACFHAAESIIAKAKYYYTAKQFTHDDRIMISPTTIPHGSFGDLDTAHFVIHPVQEYVDDTTYRYIINPIRGTGFTRYKTNIPSTLLGTRTDVIYEKTGVEGIHYIHHSGHMCIADTLESAISFCEYLFNYSPKSMECPH